LSITPLPRVWMNEPPSSSFSTRRPMPRSTTGGPATNTWLLPRTITEKWVATTRAAPSPATGPSAAPTTGTSLSSSTTRSQAGFAGTYEKPRVSSVRTEPPPPVPSTRRTMGSRSSRAIRSA
jgi:hypothetical protein